MSLEEIFKYFSIKLTGLSTAYINMIYKHLKSGYNNMDNDGNNSLNKEEFFYMSN